MSRESAAARGNEIFEVSVLKFENPWSALIDVFLEDYDGSVQDNIRMVKKITEYWTVNERDPIEGRGFCIGEIVSVKIGDFWRPALIIDSNYLEHAYQLVVLDSGHIIDAPRLDFRGLPEALTPLPRYVLFSIMDLFPAEETLRVPCVWDSEACAIVQVWLSLATSVKVVVLARQQKYHYERLFGNMYIYIARKEIDLKKWLLENNYAIEDADKFAYTYGLKSEDMCSPDKERTGNNNLVESWRSRSDSAKDEEDSNNWVKLEKLDLNEPYNEDKFTPVCITSSMKREKRYFLLEEDSTSKEEKLDVRRTSQKISVGRGRFLASLEIDNTNEDTMRNNECNTPPTSYEKGKSALRTEDEECW